MLTFTLYKSKHDSYGRPQTLSWEQWVASYFTVHEVRGSLDLRHADKETLDNTKDGPALVLGAIPEGASHKAANVTAIHALALDIDGRPEEQAFAAFAALQDYAYAAYTTFKHGTDLAGGMPRLRVIIPLAEPVQAWNSRDPGNVWHRLNALVGGINDPSTKDVSRLHFLPSTFDPTVTEAWNNPGRFLSVEELPIVRLPQKTRFESSAQGTDIETYDAISSTRRRMKHGTHDSAGPQVAKALKALERGDSLALPGERHDTLLKITWWITRKKDGRKLNEAALAELFGPSIQVMQAEDPSWDGMGEVVKLYGDAVSKRNRPSNAGTEEDYEPYSQEELEKIAAAQDCSVEELPRRWAILCGTSYFFLRGNGYYSPPANSRDEATARAHQELKRAPITLTEPTESGTRYRPATELVLHHGQVADRSVVDLTSIGGSRFDARTRTFYECASPIRVMDPLYDPQIARWLELLAGDQHETFLDWLASFPDLTRITAGLYVKGPPGVGKGLLCSGLARIWTMGSWTSLKAIFSNFNQKIIQCPLVVADEQVVAPRGEDATAILRSLIGSREHELNRKFRDSSTAHGALRVILAANNDDLLRGKVASVADQEALIQRFIILTPGEQAAKYLSSLGGFDYLNARWKDQDLIARHVMHLAMTRTVKGDRFAVTGKETAAHREALTSDYGRLVKEWLVAFAENPMMADRHPQMEKWIRVGDGEFLINSQAIKVGWRMYLGMDVREEPRLHKIGQELGQLVDRTNSDTEDGRTQRTATDGTRPRYFKIDPELLVEFSTTAMVGSPEAIARVVSRRTRT